jgi:hypothetical protein
MSKKSARRRCERKWERRLDVSDIVISEFMDEEVISGGLAGLDVIYDPGLVDRPDHLIRLVTAARALIVRNRTQVRGALFDASRFCRLLVPTICLWPSTSFVPR